MIRESSMSIRATIDGLHQDLDRLDARLVLLRALIDAYLADDGVALEARAPAPPLPRSSAAAANEP